MKCVSTRAGARAAVGLKTALLTGLAPDGGLYLPEVIPQVTPSAGQPFSELTAQLGIAWFGDEVAHDIVRTIAREAYPFPVPVIPVGDRFVCELFHGPSLSFKDVAAQFFLRVLDRVLAHDNEHAVMLTATSGDTGSAVAAAVQGRARLRAVILYPKGRISPTQEQQITTWGGNVTAVAVHGTFDDCQRLVKSMLTVGPRAIPAKAGVIPAAPGVIPAKAGTTLHLTSANSINIGRLLPQTFYYWWIALQHPHAVVVVPSGNFGNLAAGVLAKRMGAPIARFIAATNANDAVPRYLQDGIYAPQTTRHTMSNAMDVGAPSNVERLRVLYDDDVAAMRREISAQGVTDDDTRHTIRDVYRTHHYMLDPHSAVAWKASRPGDVILATAHPAKFPEILTLLLGEAPVVPPALTACFAKKPKVVELREPTEAGLMAIMIGR